MDPQTHCCPNLACPARGVVGDGNIRVHSWPERRSRGARCRKTFAAATGTVFDRRSTDPAVIPRVLTLLVHGCPPQAIVPAFGLDERTVADWQAAAGAQCRRLHEHLIEAGGVELGHFQADELRVKVVGGVVWLVTAIAVPRLLWLGGAIGAVRDEALLTAVAERVHRAAKCLDLLICTDGLRDYPTAVWHACLAPLVHRRRAIARTEALLTAGMWLVGSADNFCWVHASLRQRAAPGAVRKWVARTPAMAAGLTDHGRTLQQLLTYRVPPPPWVSPKRRSRPPKQAALRPALLAAT